MNKTDALQMIAEFSDAFGPSGFEDDVAALGRKYAPAGAAITEDHLRNLILRRKEHSGKKPVVMLDAHSDELGLMTQYVHPNGTLQFVQLGYFTPGCLTAQPFQIRTENGALVPGLVATKPLHFMTPEELKTGLEPGKMVVDVGTGSKEATEAMGIGVGTPMAPDVKFRYSEGLNTMTGKAFDCRLGCAAVLQALDALQGANLPVDVVGTLSTQEEVGTRGIQVCVQNVKPDVAIVFEGCPADEPYTPAPAVQSAMGRGPMLRYIDKGMITNPRFQRLAMDTAKKHGIPCQQAVRSGGYTNGSVTHLTGQGVPTIVISIPVRYAHTHYGISSYADWENAVKLALEIINALDADVIAGL